MSWVLHLQAKIAAGNGEQVLSRDVRRLGHNMSFFRLMTWYHTGEWAVCIPMRAGSVCTMTLVLMLYDSDRWQACYLQKYASSM